MKGNSRQAIRQRIGEKLFSTAAKARAPGKVVRRLAQISVDRERVIELARLVRDEDALVLKVADPKRQAERDVFLDELRSATLAHAPDLALAELDRAIQVVRSAEHGFHVILSTLDRTGAAGKTATSRVAAAMERIEVDLADLNERLMALLGSEAVTIQGGLLVDDGHGNPVSADVVLTALVGSLRGILTMEAHRGEWFDGQGRLTLPALPTVGPQEADTAGVDSGLAMSWMRWDRFQQLARYLDEDITVLSEAEFVNRR